MRTNTLSPSSSPPPSRPSPQTLRKRDAHRLREDFCGTFLHCCEWVSFHEGNTAVGVDNDAAVLEWGREEFGSPYAMLDEAEQVRRKRGRGTRREREREREREGGRKREKERERERETETEGESGREGEGEGEGEGESERDRERERVR